MPRRLDRALAAVAGAKGANDGCDPRSRLRPWALVPGGHRTNCRHRMDHGGPLILVRSAPKCLYPCGPHRTACTARCRLATKVLVPRFGACHRHVGGVIQGRGEPAVEPALGRQKRPPVPWDPAVSRCSVGAPCAPPVSGPCGRRGPGSAGGPWSGFRPGPGGRASRSRGRASRRRRRARRSAAGWSAAAGVAVAPPTPPVGARSALLWGPVGAAVGA